MAVFLPDTSCMVAAVCGWHEHHGSARTGIERRLNRDETLWVAAPALVETYAVLTRLPVPHRLSPADALTLLESNFIAGRRNVELEGETYVALLRQAPTQGISGGRTYDAVIAECAPKTAEAAILTFNPTHFSSFARQGLTIVVPGGA
jgi:predicted nucleic acid-binding protein